MAINRKSAEQLIKLLKEKVQAGTLDRETAEKLAVLAVQEIQPDEAEAAEPVEAPVEEAPVEAPPPPPPSIDPSASLMKIVADFDASVTQLWNKTQVGIDEVLKGLEGAAFPLGDFSTKTNTSAKGNATKLLIKKAQGKNDTAEISFSFDRGWEISPVTLPQGVEASVEPACHMGLRKELLALAQDVIDATDSELSWKRTRLAEKTIAFLTKESAKENDQRVFEIMKVCPNERSRDEWRQWSLAAQVYLLGSDYSTAKNFNEIAASIKG